MANAIDRIDAFERASPEIRLELIDGKFLVGGSLFGSQWLLREIIAGWGKASCLGFAPLDMWYQALQIACGCPLDADLQTWVINYPYQTLSFPPLGSQYLGEHRHIRMLLLQDLATAVSIGGLGQCIGRDYVMYLGKNAFTPDVMFIPFNQLAGYHNWFFAGLAKLIVEVLLPEQAEIDKKDRFQLYQAAGIENYWIIDPATQQVEIFGLVNRRYQPQTLAPDGCYRGIEDLTFTPQHIWLPYNQKLPIFQAPYKKHNWALREMAGEELGWGRTRLGKFTFCADR